MVSVSWAAHIPPRALRDCSSPRFERSGHALWARHVWRWPSTCVCLQGLSLVLSEGSLRDGDKEPPMEEDSGDAETLQGYQWLLRDLPRLPLFDSVRATTALALQQVGGWLLGEGQSGRSRPSTRELHSPPFPGHPHGD